MAKYLDYEGLKHFVGKIKSLVNGKADKKHSHTCSEIANPELDLTYNSSDLDEYLLNLQMDIQSKPEYSDLNKKIGYLGQIPAKNIQIIEKGASTSGIPNETMIYELE